MDQWVLLPVARKVATPSELGKLTVFSHFRRLHYFILISLLLGGGLRPCNFRGTDSIILIHFPLFRSIEFVNTETSASNSWYKILRTYHNGFQCEGTTTSTTACRRGIARNSIKCRLEETACNTEQKSQLSDEKNETPLHMQPAQKLHLVFMAGIAQTACIL